LIGLRVLPFSFFFLFLILLTCLLLFFSPVFPPLWFRPPISYRLASSDRPGTGLGAFLDPIIDIDLGALPGDPDLVFPEAALVQLGDGAVGVGFVAGMLLPATRVENEKIGPMADQLKEQAKETGQEAIERGKHVAEQAAETVKEEGRQQAQEMAPSSTS